MREEVRKWYHRHNKQHATSRSLGRGEGRYYEGEVSGKVGERTPTHHQIVRS